MINLYQLVTGAHGGQGLDTLAKQFGLTREQADGAVRALMPALSTAFMSKAAQPGGLGELAGAMADDDHRQAYADPDAAQQPQTQRKGDAVAGSIFGNGAVLDQVVTQASRFTGIPEVTLRSMLPVIVSMVLGGAATTMQAQGLSGFLGEMAHGGLSGILEQFGSAAHGQGAPGSMGGAGGFAGMVGNIVNSFMGGTHPAGAQTPAPPKDGVADPAASLPPMVQAGIDMFGKMFQAGIPASPAGPADLGETDASQGARRR